MDIDAFTQGEPKAIQVVEGETEVKTENEPKRRGWLFDQILQVGQIEASLEHIDEEVCNIYSDLDNIDDEQEAERQIDKLSNLKKLTDELYSLRVKCMLDIYEAFPEADKHSWCLVKHLSLVYAKAAENWHARKQVPEAEAEMVQAGRCLALECSNALGFEPMGCLRCLDEQTSKYKKAVASK